MNPFRIALANIRFPADPEDSITLARQAVAQAAIEGARIVCFPECFVTAIARSVRPCRLPHTTHTHKKKREEKEKKEKKRTGRRKGQAE